VEGLSAQLEQEVERHTGGQPGAGVHGGEVQQLAQQLALAEGLRWP